MRGCCRVRSLSRCPAAPAPEPAGFAEPRVATGLVAVGCAAAVGAQPSAEPPALPPFADQGPAAVQGHRDGKACERGMKA